MGGPEYWSKHKFTNNANWCDGDFDVNGSIDAFDVAAWSANKFKTSKIEYGAQGNQTQDDHGKAVVWDAWNRIVEQRSGSTVERTFRYDGLGRRNLEDNRSIYYTAGWQAIEEFVPSGATEQVETSYVWSPIYVDALLVQDNDTNGDGVLDERLHALQDANFNITAVTDSSGNVIERYQYDAYGERTILATDFTTSTSPALINHGFAGGKHDDVTGRVHFRHRDYDTGQFRWANQDPIGFYAGDANVYRFVASNPVNRRDPSGLFEGAHFNSPDWKAYRDMQRKEREKADCAAKSAAAKQQKQLDRYQALLDELIKLGDEHAPNKEEWKVLREYLEYAKKYDGKEGTVNLHDGSARNPLFPRNTIELDEDTFYDNPDMTIADLIHEAMHDIQSTGPAIMGQQAAHGFKGSDGLSMNDIIGPYSVDNYWSRFVNKLYSTKDENGKSLWTNAKTNVGLCPCD